MDQKDKDFYDDLPYFVKNSIEKGLEDIENGNCKPHEEVMQTFKNKYVVKKNYDDIKRS